MKNLIKFLIVAMIAMISIPAMSQGVEKTVSVGMSLNQYYYMSSTDIAIAGDADSSIIYSIFLQKPELALYDIRLNIDSVSEPNLAVGLYGKSFVSDEWTQIGSDISYTGGTPDTTVLFTEVSTAVNYRYLGIKMTSQTAASQASVDWVGLVFKLKQ